VEWAEDDLLKMGVPGKAIVKLSYTSSGSIHDALNTRKYILAKGLKSLVVVTSDYHTRRSLWAFERVFRGYPVKIGVYPAKCEVKSEPYLRRFMILSYEMLKLVYYKCRYNYFGQLPYVNAEKYILSYRNCLTIGYLLRELLLDDVPQFTSGSTPPPSGMT
jgi:hypothetical protein